jgi:hypothetical protein
MMVVRLTEFHARTQCWPLFEALAAHAVI